MTLASFAAHAARVLSERLRPGTLEFALMFYQPLAYWLVAGVFDILDHLKLPFTERYKVVRREPGRGNTITRRQVILRVLLQQFIQTLLSLAMFVFDPDQCDRCTIRTGLLHRASKFVLGMFVMDAWQYWIHRLMHTNTFLYKHLHSVHHTLMIPYAYGALYNSVLEGLILDSLGGVFTLYAAGLDCQTATYLFVFANIKTVVDHCNYRGPVNPIHGLLPNCAAYHDIHHDMRFIKMNFSQPFFTHWDWLLGTFVDPAGLHWTPEEIKMQQLEAAKGGKQQAGETKKAR
ncbi:hypothetical protein GPECTOR_19g369 [Gonium pectorale]|uniref:Fatty acid hydroxylase domain-containing protein n=1 Tax=Gonium pectorale TaxID=33097 RepID=A0A150GJD0_GONPE|nr:hypothetical protein GPECTOR_19g369 [Gonium pectorale]|eukprot:KXZ49918.1 hypothetical protein GPECTOR_19g369 [Gonium pectorale]